MTDKDIVGPSNFEKYLTEQYDPDKENVSLQPNELTASTPYPTKRALSFGGFDRAAKKHCNTTDPSISKLSRSLPLADTKRLHSKHSLKMIEMKDVERRLAAIKVKNVKRVSSCVKAAISKSHIRMTGSVGLDMNRVLHRGPLRCGHMVSAILADVLYQPDYVGIQPSALLRLATVFCPYYKKGYCPDGWAFVTGMCKGKPHFDWTGRRVNHCKKCDSTFGECTDDYRSIHCPVCGEHYSSSSCSNCYPDTVVGSDSDHSANSNDTVIL